MDKIKIITDTASDIDIITANENDICMLPFTIVVDGKQYKEQYDLSKEEYWSILSECETIPSTAQVSPQEFLDCYIEQ